MCREVTIDSGILLRYAQHAAADVSDADEHPAVMDPGVRAVWPGARLAGRAVTVSTPPGDNLAVREALALLGPGDVLVVDGGGDVGHALVGELTGMAAVRRGAAGFVVDGAVRDVARLEDLRIPVFARAVTPRGPSRVGQGTINVEVTVGGVAVRPGDVVVADADGVVVVAADRAAATIAAADGLRDGSPESRLLEDN